MMHWLLKNEGYPPAVVVSVLLHVVLVVAIFLLSRDRHPVRLEPPLVIQATTTRENPQKVRHQERLAEQRIQNQQKQQAEEANRKAQVERFQKELIVKQEAEKKLQAEKQQAQQQKLKQEQEAEKQRQAAREKQLQEQQKKQKEADDRLKAQQELDLAIQKATTQKALTEEEQMIARYVSLIKQLVSQQWSQPPSARNGMVALVELRLTPTGEIINKQIVQGSGDAFFDRSVIQAIDKVGRFEDFKTMPPALFERKFRQFTLEFKPEDLIR